MANFCREWNQPVETRSDPIATVFQWFEVFSIPGLAYEGAGTGTK